MEEISRRIMFNEEEGMACGPISLTSIDAEIVVEDEKDGTVFLHGEWVLEAGDEICYDVTKRSIYDIHEKLVNCEDGFDELIMERDEIREKESLEDKERYASYLDEITKMIRDEIQKQGYEFDNEDWEEDDIS